MRSCELCHVPVPDAVHCLLQISVAATPSSRQPKQRCAHAHVTAQCRTGTSEGAGIYELQDVILFQCPVAMFHNAMLWH